MEDAHPALATEEAASKHRRPRVTAAIHGAEAAVTPGAAADHRTSAVAAATHLAAADHLTLVVVAVIHGEAADRTFAVEGVTPAAADILAEVTLVAVGTTVKQNVGS